MQDPLAIYIKMGSLIGWLGRTPDIQKPPVIIISSSDPASYREQATAAGVKASLQKPLNKEALLAAIQSVLGEAGPAGPASQT